nr:DNA-directed DNA polymerase [Tanacetum cinerariifolium]
MSIQLADRSIKYPIGVYENLLVKVSKFIFPVDFVVLEMDEDELVLIILGRPFLATARAVIDVHKGKLSLRVRSETVTFNIGKSMKSKHTYEFKPSVQSQRRVNPDIKEVVKKEVIKLLDAGLIYLIFDSPWVSPVQVVPKKGGITVVKNEKHELIPQRTVTGWHKTTFTCHYGTFAYKQMPFGLCNAPATFQRCMTVIFHELIEDIMEVFTDDFSFFGSSFDHCLKNLKKMLKRYEETNLVLNWEKCHFMVKKGIVLGHKVSSLGIEVDKAKIKAISKLPYPTNVKAIRSFLGHAGFYIRFIKYFSQIVRPMTQLLIKDAQFNFSKECIQAFDKLKRELTQAPIMIKPDWSLPFEVVCDTCDYTIRVVLGQRIDKHFKPIHYASKIMNEAQENYTTIEKELLTVVFPFDKFQFDIEIRDKKSAENIIVDHLSRLENPDLRKLTKAEIRDLFPEERLMAISDKNNKPCNLRHYFWDEPFLFKQCADRIIRRCIAGDKAAQILRQCHNGLSGGHHGIATTARKVFKFGFYWPHIFRDAPNGDVFCYVTAFGGTEKGAMKMMCEIDYGSTEVSFIRICKLLMEAIEKRYGGNKESKKRNKAEIETISLNDLYNNLKIYEPELTRSSSTSQNPQNVAFVSSNSTSSTNEADNTAYGVSIAHTQGNTVNFTYVDNLSDDVICTFLASQPNSPQLAREDLEQIDPDDLEEMDLKSKVECFNCYKNGHFARECRTPKTQENRGREYGRKTMPVENPTENALIAQDGIRGKINILNLEVKLRDNALDIYTKNLEKAEKERDELKLTLEKFQNSSKSLNNLLEIQVSDKVKTGLGYKAASPVEESFVKSSKMLENKENVKSKSDKGYHTVPPPYTGNYIPPKPDLMFIDEQVKSEFVDVVSTVSSSAVKTVESKVESVDVKTKDVCSTVEIKLVKKNKFSPPIIKDWISDDESEVEFEPKVKDKNVRPSIEKIKFVKTAKEKEQKVETPKQHKHYPRRNQTN